MKFEMLPNEIIADVLEYFDGVDLFRAFYGLNSRLNYLLYYQCRSYNLNFLSISKRDFDTVCQQHLPFIADRVLTIGLSNEKYTPKQINLFLSYISSLNQFIQLRSLSLHYVNSYKIIMNIINQCQHLENLTHLYFNYDCSSDQESSFQLLVNNIWSLPKLIQCRFSIHSGEYWFFPLPTIISSSLKNLSINSNEFSLNDVHLLFQYTPGLRQLNVNVSVQYDDYKPSPILSLTSLDISSSLPVDLMVSFFHHLPNLCRLNLFSLVHDMSKIIYGNQWEYGIRNALTKLKEFRLTLIVSLYNTENIEHEAQELFNSFRSSFWLEERQWFVRCYTSTPTIHLHTVSGTHSYSLYGPIQSFRSTYPHDNPRTFYDNVETCSFETVFDEPLPSDILLPNISDLLVKFPIDDQFWSIISKLDRLSSLQILNYNDNFQSQFQALLNRAPSCLASLSVSQNFLLSMPMSLFENTNITACELNLQWLQPGFNEQQCIELCRSSLSTQCKILCIRVDNRESIIYLIKNMMKLRTLNVICKDDKIDEIFESSGPIFCNETMTLINDELVQWLKDHLPSTHSITRIWRLSEIIGIWI